MRGFSTEQHEHLNHLGKPRCIPRLQQSCPPLFDRSTATLALSIAGESLRKLRSFANRWSFPVEDIDWDRNQECKAGKDRGRILKLMCFTYVRVHCKKPQYVAIQSA